MKVQWRREFSTCRPLLVWRVRVNSVQWGCNDPDELLSTDHMIIYSEFEPIKHFNTNIQQYNTPTQLRTIFGVCVWTYGRPCNVTMAKCPIGAGNDGNVLHASFSMVYNSHVADQLDSFQPPHTSKLPSYTVMACFGRASSIGVALRDLLDEGS
jgi:hypothetical protein